MADIVRTSIGGGYWLAPDAAASYQRMRDAALPAGMTSAGRDWDRQMYLYDGWNARRPGFNFALHPSKSKHCLGLAIDVPGNVNDVRTPRGWMRASGAGFRDGRPTFNEWGWRGVENEKWHFEYDPAHDQHLEDDMPLNAADKKWLTTELTRIARAEAKTAAAEAVKGLLKPSTGVAHTPLTQRLIKASGSDHDGAVRFADTAAYAQAAAFALEALIERQPSTVGDVVLEELDMKVLVDALAPRLAELLAQDLANRIKE